MRSACVCLALLVCALATSAGEPPEKVRRNVRVISSAEAKGSIDTEKLQLCFWHLLEQQGLTDREPPKVLILHVSKSEAAVAGVHDNIVRVETVESPADNYYQVWLIDNFKPAHYLVAFEAIIRRAFGVSLTQEQENEILTRALRMQNSTITAKEH